MSVSGVSIGDYAEPTIPGILDYQGDAIVLLTTDDYTWVYNLLALTWEESLESGFNVFLSGLHSSKNVPSLAYGPNPFSNSTSNHKRTDTAGATWTTYGKPTFTIQQSFPQRLMFGFCSPKDTDIYVIEVTRTTAFVINGAVGIWKSVNGGSSWTRIVGDSSTQFNGEQRVRGLFANASYLYQTFGTGASNPAGVTRYNLDGTGATNILLPSGAGIWSCSTIEGDPLLGSTPPVFITGNYTVEGRRLFRLDGTTLTEVTPPSTIPVSSNEIYTAVDGAVVLCLVTGYTSPDNVQVGEIWRSADNGDSWTCVFGPMTDLGRDSGQSSTQHPIDILDNNAFVATSPNEPDLGFNGNMLLWGSPDNGITWERAQGGLIGPADTDTESKFNLPHTLAIIKQ
jgi:hypothetical protein